MNRKILLILIVLFSLLGISFTFICKPSEQLHKIFINEEEWNAIVGSRKQGNLSLQSLKFNDYDLVIDEKNHKVYYSLIDHSSNKFFPAVSYMANSPNTEIAVLNDEITEEKMMNHHEFQILLYDNNFYQIYGMYCTIFPMLNIVYDESDSADERNRDMHMYLFNNSANGINRVVKSEGIIHEVEMEDGTYHFRFSLVMTTPGNNERENVISLLHMRPGSEYYLNAIKTAENTSPLKLDKKELNGNRERIKSEEDISGDNRLEGKERNEQKRVELFINNEYMGLYSLSYNPDVKVKLRNK